jgi:ribosomal protein L12E/L44/L45/RPP1/RPP2
MQCERLIKQIKAWYIHVSNETMAPARMVSFIEKHATECDICLDDPDLQEEIEKITEMILPESKIPKAVRMQQEQEEHEKRAATNEDKEIDIAEEEDEDLGDGDGDQTIED